jgi:uncharacterized membrane protein YoaK (UPF0700 family)
MAEEKKYLECEKLWVFALLIFVAGIYGAYTLSVRGGVFCNAQTGNMALFGVALGSGNWKKALYYLIPMGGYLLGSMVAEGLPRHVRRFRLRWDTLLMLIEILAVVVVGFVPADAPHQISQIIINFVCAMQYNTFRQAEGIGSATTFCTNHTRMLGSNLVRVLFRKEKQAGEKVRSHGVMLLSFVAGAVISSFFCVLIGVRAIWVALIPLVVLFVDLLKADLTGERDMLSVIPRGH